MTKLFRRSVLQNERTLVIIETLGYATVITTQGETLDDCHTVRTTETHEGAVGRYVLVGYKLKKHLSQPIND